MINDYELKRRYMVESQIVKRGIKDKNVINAMLKVERHLFVNENFKNEAYEDYPLPIGENQTISQPYIVALMSEALELNRQSKVLEIGTGCGYQTAILAEIAKEVYTIERIESLSLKARQTLNLLGYKNIFFKIGNGVSGWEKNAPFDAIVVTAAAKRVYEAYIKQLSEKGRLVIPVEDGRFSEYQTLKKIVKLNNEQIEEYSLGGCRFVPLIDEFYLK